ncbi:MAG: S-layer homology domain-containing protein [Thermaerobacter sp.]|jgi:photosystem II stability/assembly factor-like uncharacterized protein|nr:S-layer homology domain-containing protein [Thermaerobacter sp.]
MTWTKWTIALAASLLSLFALVQAASAAPTDAAWVTLPPGPVPVLRGISCPDPAHCWAVGQDSSTGRGEVLSTVNGGQSWSVTQPGPDASWTGVSFPDAQHGWVVGANGTVLSTTDGGKTWLPQVSGSQGDLSGVACSDLRRCVIVGYDPASGQGTLLFTNNGGATWSSAADGQPLPQLFGAFCLGTGTCWAVGYDQSSAHGVILSDAGGTWSVQTTSVPHPLTGIFFADPAHGWAVGVDGVILTTTDGGKTWKTQASGTGAFLSGVTFSDRWDGWAVGGAGTVLFTLDGGRIWKSQNVGTQSDLFGATCVPGSAACWAVGKAGVWGTSPLTAFPDLSQASWAEKAVGALLRENIVSGLAPGVFAPQGTLTRAQFATLLVKAAGLTPAPVPAATPFADVDPGAWYGPYVAAAFYAGMVRGVSDTSFAPDAPVTREQMAVMLARLLPPPGAPGGATNFADASRIASWAQGSVAATAATGLLAGFPDGSFRPLGTATRAEAAEVIDKYLQFTFQSPGG